MNYIYIQVERTKLFSLFRYIIIKQNTQRDKNNKNKVCFFFFFWFFTNVLFKNHDSLTTSSNLFIFAGLMNYEVLMFSLK